MVARKFRSFDSKSSPRHDLQDEKNLRLKFLNLRAVTRKVFMIEAEKITQC